MRLLLVFALLILPVAAETAYTPKAGTKERTEILDAIRDPVEDALHQEVTFQVKHLVVKDGWAFFDGLPLTKAGKKVSYKGTMYEEWVEDADEVLWVLLRNKRGRWYIVNKVFFTTDVTWVEWPKYYRAPAEIFPKLKLD